MSLLAMLAAEDPSQTHSWLWPENYEMIWGIPASILIFGLLFWKAGPVLVKAFRARTARVQAQLDDAAADTAAADAEAAEVRRALGDLEAERARMLADADEQAAALKRDGAARLEAEVADLEAKATADIAALASRGVDELRSEIARLSAAAAEHVVNGQLTAEVHRDLIEGFIQKVGATQGVSQ
jgi:F-type H+-transporting ATPase subunit b